MKKSLLLAAATFAVGMASAVSAAPLFVIDDFNTAPANPWSAYLDAQGDSDSQGPIGYSIAGKYFQRTIQFDSVADSDTPDDDNGFGAYLDVGNHVLSINNDAGVRSQATLTYNISSLYGQIAANSAVKLGVTFSNGLSTLNGPTTIEAFLGQTSLGMMTLSQRIDTPLTPEVFSNILLLGSQLNGNDQLRFVINGPADYDLTLEQIAVDNYVVASDVPEPAMLGLFGLGAIGLGLARRRQR